MGKQSKQEYLLAIQCRYQTASKAEKQPILDEFCHSCEYHRKYAIQLLSKRRKQPSRSPQRSGRRPQYDDPVLLLALRIIWFATDQMCGKRLVRALPLWLPHYEAEKGTLTDSLRIRLLSASAATLDRLLKPLRVQHPKGLSGTKPGSLLKNQIPIRCEHWDVTVPGFMEADTVAHCGNSLSGDFVWSVSMTDILTGWTVCRATWNKGAEGVLTQIKSIEAALPFKLCGFDCDNGSEFLNHHLLRYFTDHPEKPAFTRSRPYKKNDNAHIEQKNWSHVRQLFGYDRFDKPVLTALMNDLYATEWDLLQNYFCPSFKLKEKVRDGAKVHKTYHAPQTPYQRIMDCEHVSQEAKDKLKTQQQGLNPFELKRQIERKLKRIFSHITVSSNVRLRL